jgi:hypothetical protein
LLHVQGGCLTGRPIDKVVGVFVRTLACSNDEETVSGTGTVALEFDNSFKGDDLILETQKNKHNQQ